MGSKRTARGPLFGIVLAALRHEVIQHIIAVDLSGMHVIGRGELLSSGHDERDSMQHNRVPEVVASEE